jgi:hypothetical protein
MATTTARPTDITRTILEGPLTITTITTDTMETAPIPNAAMGITMEINGHASMTIKTRPSQQIITKTTLPIPITTAVIITTTIIIITITTMATTHVEEAAKMAETQETTIRKTSETRINKSNTHGASHATKPSAATQDTN